MAMTTGSHASINVTPLIDVLLVLLIIFMVITPVTPVGLQAALPQEGAPNAAPAQPPVVIEVRSGGRARLNSQEIAVADLASHLAALFHGLPTATVFVDGEGSLEYGEVARVIDIAKGAGVRTVGLMPGK